MNFKDNVISFKDLPPADPALIDEAVQLMHWDESLRAKRPTGIAEDESWYTFLDELEQRLPIGSNISIQHLGGGQLIARHGDTAFTWPAGKWYSSAPAIDWLATPDEPQAASRNTVISAEDFAGDTGPREWLIEDVVTADAELVAIVGPSKSCKSFFALDLAASLHRGATWHGRAVKRSRVVYVIAEGAGDFRFRMAAYAQAHGIALRDLFPVVANAPNMLDAKQVADLAHEIVRSGGAGTIVLDTLTATAPGGEQNSAKEMSLYIENLKSLRRITGAQVWYLHHSGRDEAKGQRGSTALLAAVDCELTISRNGDISTVELSKSKAAAESQILAFNLKPVDLGIDQRGKPYGSCVIAPIQAQPTARVITRRLSKDKAVTWYFDAVAQLVEKNGGQPVPFQSLLDVVYETKVKQPGKKDNRASHTTTYVNRLIESGHLHKHGEDISIYQHRATNAPFETDG